MQYVAMATRTVCSYCGASLVKSCCKTLKIVLFIIIDQNLAKFMICSPCKFTYFESLNISGMERDI